LDVLLIYYLVTKAFSNTIRSFLATWGKTLNTRIRIIHYHRAFRQKRFCHGTYIFTDLERLSVQESEWAAAIHNTLVERWGNRITILNHPTRSMKRYELLRALNNAGINSHNAFRLTDGKFSENYPVFIRGADDHRGASTALIHSESELHQTITKLNREGISREDKIIVEFCDTADDAGIYRKYSAFSIDGTIIPRHICFSRDWQIKYPDLSTPALIDEELAFINNNHHAAQLRQIFAMAGIRYGRIDYGLRNGRIQVWEINTNPRIASFVSAENPARQKIHDLFVERLNQAYEGLDSNCVVIAGRAGNPVRKRLLLNSVLGHAKFIGESLVFLLPFSPRHNGMIRAKLVALKNRIQNSQS
jgi:hypothetical protein